MQPITDWAHQWNVVFNQDVTKQEIEVIVLVKKKMTGHPELVINDIPVSIEDHSKHLGVYLGSRLTFSKHI